MVAVFIYTLRASSIKFFAVVLLSVVVLISLITLIPEYGSAGDVAVVAVNYGDIKTNEDRIEFIKQFGYTPLTEPSVTEEVIIPEKFDTVYEKYNDIQRAQGLNLKKYQGKSAMKYTYLLEDYPGSDGRVFFTMLVYRDNVIAGDVCRTEGERFIHGFEMPQQPRTSSEGESAQSE
ncbi:MAG: DUF4830 domain-containing protein [Clostridiales bacterium]|nr:MAG: DUF4830 domain-containing protein [Clostridiales bacterium]